MRKNPDVINSRCRLLTGITTTKRRSIATMPTANVFPSCPCLALRSQIVTGTADQLGSKPVHNEMNSNADSYSDNSHQHRTRKIRSQCACIHPKNFRHNKNQRSFHWFMHAHDGKRRPAEEVQQPAVDSNAKHERRYKTKQCCA